MSNSDKKEKGVGYGQPPKSNQFKPGKSGNPKGRPKKPDPSIVDLDATLSTEFPVNGTLMDSREVELRQQVKKARDVKSPIKHMIHVLDEFEKYGAMKPPEQKARRYVPPPLSEIPWNVQIIANRKFGLRKWTKQEIDAAKAEYLASRDEGDRIFDKKIGDEEWLMS